MLWKDSGSRAMSSGQSSVKGLDYWIVSDPKSRRVQCLLCPHVCVISPGEKGRCRVRSNKDGKLHVENYGLVTACAIDPLEKKPLKRFYPGKNVLSLGAFGCNLACGFCQNWRIAQGETPPSRYLSPEEAVEKALKYVSAGNIGIAYTYSEPLMWYDYVLDTAKLVKKAGLKNILVTNGYINPKPLTGLLPYLDAVNLDVKAFTNQFYQKVCQGTLQPVLKSAQAFAEHCHLEITTLVIPALNDSPDEIRELSQWIKGINPNIPLHINRYFPNYHMSLAPTPVETMERLKSVAQEALPYVFLGNV